MEVLLQKCSFCMMINESVPHTYCYEQWYCWFSLPFSSSTKIVYHSIYSNNCCAILVWGMMMIFLFSFCYLRNLINCLEFRLDVSDQDNIAFVLRCFSVCCFLLLLTFRYPPYSSDYTYPAVSASLFMYPLQLLMLISLQSCFDLCFWCLMKYGVIDVQSKYNLV